MSAASTIGGPTDELVRKLVLAAPIVRLDRIAAAAQRLARGELPSNEAIAAAFLAEHQLGR